jgi:hypothetical protein
MAIEPEFVDFKRNYPILADKTYTEQEKRREWV